MNRQEQAIQELSGVKSVFVECMSSAQYTGVQTDSSQQPGVTVERTSSCYGIARLLPVVKTS